MKTPPRISPSEREVLAVLWKSSPLSTADLVDALAASKGWSRGTTRTLLARLVRKKAVGCRLDGNRHLYRPLVAEEASVRHESRNFLQRVFAGASADPLGEMTLASDELIVAIELPAAAAGGAQHWEKIMQRGAWDFALVSCAAARHTDGVVRMALGGVGLGPWRIAESVEEDVASGGLDEDSIDALAERAMYDAVPLKRNGYKVDIARAVLRRAMRALAKP